jgi:hypothetical protein
MAAVTFSHRHLVIAGLVTALACGGQRVAVAPLPASPEATVEGFLAAVNDADLERMAGLWGDERGPSNVTNRIPRAQRLQRLTIMQRVLRHDNRRVVASDAANSREAVLRVELTQGTRRFTVPFTCVASRTGGWLVRDIGLEAAMPAASPRSDR